MDQDLRELEITWQNLKPKMEELCRDSQAAWAQRLSELSARLEGVLVGVVHDPIRVKDAFRDYRSQVSRSFNRVDWDLRSLCGMLVRAGDELAPMLGMIV